MKRPPLILVQLVHIQGPLKGEIQEFSEPQISVGRHQSSHVKFPKDLTIISRKHAEIVREGNRFKLIDHSTNGTLVNGKRVQETYLKDGDVLTFADGGPKLSFLTKMTEAQPEIESMPPPRPSTAKEPVMSFDEKHPLPQAQPKLSQADDISIHKVQATLVIQYGPTLRSFKELPVIIGKNPDCDFVLDHPALFGRHAQIFFSQGQYWVKDLTGQQFLSINGQPVYLQAPLNPDDSLAFTPRGPNFRFLGGGRLAEIEGSMPQQPLHRSHEKEEIPGHQRPGHGEVKWAKTIFKKFLRG